MDFIKKNLALSLLILICLLAFAAGAYLTFAEAGKVDSAQKKINSAEAQLKNLLVASPAPSAQNVAAAEQNVADLVDELEKIRLNLQRGSQMTVSRDGVRVMSSIQQFLSEYQRRAATFTDAEGEVTPLTESNFGFGFELYLEKGEPIQDKKANMAMDKQRQILVYLLDKLLTANPTAIKAVERELLEVKKTGKEAKATAQSGFKIASAISARVPGAIDTLAFSITFQGYTDSLRIFINSLAQFDLPIVVRSIEVDRPQGSETVAVAKPSGGGLEDLFGGFGGTSPASAEEPKEDQKPVISENISTFTVVLEFIEIIIPSESENNPS
ncbi:MAG: hypothetical protein ACSHX4_00785 [Opitutaceae bacterium]